VSEHCILIVDDEKSIRSLVQRWFSTRGFSVDVAENGEEAVALCASNDYDLITMDLDMPGMGGLAAIEEIHKTKASIPIIVLTGYARDIHRSKDRGAIKVCVKPIRLTELEEEVRSVLAGMVT
jgi:CheY-like chemotaxis protein